MRKRFWTTFTALIASSAILLQTPSCAQISDTLADIAQIVTAGGVLFLVQRVIN